MPVNNVISGNIEVMNNESSLAYPSANAINGGEINSEENIREIVNRITKQSFVIRALPTEDDPLYDQTIEDYQYGRTFTLKTLNLWSSNSKLFISPGEANIKGYYYKNTQQTEIDIDTYIKNSETLSGMINNWDSYVYIDTSTGTPIAMNYIRLYVYLNVQKDSVDHILSYDAEGANYSNFRGVTVGLTNDPNSNFDLLLGYILINKDNNDIITISGSPTNNTTKFYIYDLDSLYKKDYSTGDIYNLYDILNQYMQHNKSFYNDVSIFGNDPEDEYLYNYVSNLYLTRPSISNLALRVYFVTNSEGGIAICKPIYNDNESEILSFDENSLVEIIKFNFDYNSDNVSDITLNILPERDVNDNYNTLNINGNVNISDSNTIDVEVDNSININSRNSIDINTENINIGTESGGSNINVHESNIQFENPYEDEVSTEIRNDRIIAERVYGAVWA